LHFVGIPLLLVASLGLLSKLALPGSAEWPALRPNVAWVMLLVAVAWYAWQDQRMGLLVGSAMVGGYAVGSPLPIGILAGLFGIGIFAHVVGHYAFERKPPAVFSRPIAVTRSAGVASIDVGRPASRAHLPTCDGELPTDRMSLRSDGVCCDCVSRARARESARPTASWHSRTTVTDKCSRGPALGTQVDDKRNGDDEVADKLAQPV
jgi:hypothetical protein